MLFDWIPSGADETRLMGLMRDYGDTLLRTCYMLCGDIRTAREAVKAAFAEAHRGMLTGERSDLSRLLRLALSRCPCRRLVRRGIPLAQLPPPERKAALLCLYHGLSIDEAAWVLGITPDEMGALLERAKAFLF